MATPVITDRQLLRRRIARAYRDSAGNRGYLVDSVIDDLEGRLASVNRRFPKAIAMNGFSGRLADKLAGNEKTDIVYRMELCAELIGPDRRAFVGDEEWLPIAPASVDLIVSPLTLHFVNDLPGALLQIRQALRPDGMFLAALLGGATLSELKHVFTQVEAGLRGGAGPRFLPLADIRDLGALLQRAGFALPVADRDIITVRYDTAIDLMQDLKAMGASNPLADRERRFMRRDVLASVAELYRQRYSDPDGRIRATFEIISLSGWAPHESQQKPAARGSAQISLADYLEKGRGS